MTRAGERGPGVRCLAFGQADVFNGRGSVAGHSDLVVCPARGSSGLSHGPLLAAGGLREFLRAWWDLMMPGEAW